MTGARAVFVDRDGVVNELVPDPGSGWPESPLRVDDVRLIPGAAAALRGLAAGGWPIVGVSNQPSAAKGLMSLAELHAVQARVLELLAAEGAQFDDFRLCLHHPEGVIPELTGECDCRKPAPGMLLAAAEERASTWGARGWSATPTGMCRPGARPGAGRFSWSTPTAPTSGRRSFIRTPSSAI